MKVRLGCCKRGMEDAVSLCRRADRETERQLGRPGQARGPSERGTTT